MPRITPNEELQLIESIVASHPSGLGISAIEAEMERRHGKKPNRRTLQRRLQKLIDDHRLTTSGESIALVYKIAGRSQSAEQMGGLGSSSKVGGDLEIGRAHV